MRFAIFSREQQHTQKSSGGADQGAGGSSDLVSYVEFQRNFNMAIKSHTEALLAIRAFWSLLTHSNVRFNAVAAAVKRMDESIRAAERVYRTVVQRHTTNVKMVRLYAKFMQVTHAEGSTTLHSTCACTAHHLHMPACAASAQRSRTQAHRVTGQTTQAHRVTGQTTQAHRVTGQTTYQFPCAVQTLCVTEYTDPPCIPPSPRPYGMPPGPTCHAP